MTTKPAPKARPRPTVREFHITHNLPPGTQLVIPPRAVKDLVRLFGEKALARVDEERKREQT